MQSVLFDSLLWLYFSTKVSLTLYIYTLNLYSNIYEAIYIPYTTQGVLIIQVHLMWAVKWYIIQEEHEIPLSIESDLNLSC